MELKFLLEHLRVNGLSLNLVPVRYNGKVIHTKAIILKEGVFKDVELIVENAEEDLTEALFDDKLLGKPRRSTAKKIGTLGKAIKQAKGDVDDI